MMFVFHSFHLVTKSPWPVFCSLSALGLTTSTVFMFKYAASTLLFYNLPLVTLFSFLWWRDVSREGVILGDHTTKVQDGLKWGMFLFIFSEVLFFTAWFWAFFHNSLSPVQDIGLLWPPLEVMPLSPFSVPLLNTAILLSSGVSVTWAHHKMQANKEVVFSLMVTLALGLVFTLFQGFEYINSTFSVSDSVFGTSFFVTTGFHGLHVIIGTIFLGYCLMRARNMEMVYSHHLGFEFAIWYWHFVDVVWLFLFSFVYWWGFF